MEKSSDEIVRAELTPDGEGGLVVGLDRLKERVKELIGSSKKPVWYLECSNKFVGEERDYYPVLVEAEEPSGAILRCVDWLENWLRVLRGLEENSFQIKLYPPGRYTVEGVAWRSNPAGGGIAGDPLHYYPSGKPQTIQRSFILILGHAPYRITTERDKEIRYIRKEVKREPCSFDEFQGNFHWIGERDGYEEYYMWLHNPSTDQAYSYLVERFPEALFSDTYLKEKYPERSSEEVETIRAALDIITIDCYQDCEPVLIAPGSQVFKGVEAIRAELDRLSKNLRF